MNGDPGLVVKAGYKSYAFRPSNFEAVCMGLMSNSSHRKDWSTIPHSLLQPSVELSHGTQHKRVRKGRDQRAGKARQGKDKKLSLFCF